MIVAIDGPAGAGKSTVARTLARALGFAYLDSGAMYRCVALLSIAEPGMEPATLARSAKIELSVETPHAPSGSRERGGPEPADRRILLNGRDVTDEIRAPKVSEVASRVASDPGVRAALVEKQRELIARGDWVVEGRDIGTVVAPDAELKVFLTADPGERARRRAAELGADLEVVLAEQTLRDERDSAREHSPLRPAPGAVTLDTSALSLQQVVDRIAELVLSASPSA